MKESKLWSSTFFYGNEISDYGKTCGYVDYRTLSKAFDAVLNNDIMSRTEAAGIGYWEQESGYVDNSEQIEQLEEQIENQEQPEALEELEAKKEQLEAEKAELENEQDEQPEIFQFYIVDDPGAEILKEFNEIVFYNSEIDMYLWGVTHYGTSWDYVLTDIKIDPAALKDEV